MLAPLALLLLAANPPQVDPLEAAHARRDPAHVMPVFKVESAIEDVNRHTVTVFGTRREYRCPGGELASETRCDPCTYASDDWADRPEDEWIYEITWGTPAEHEAATKEAAHFARYFELEPRPGQEKGGKQHVMYAFDGKTRAPPPPPQVSKLRLLVGGVERDAAAIPFGQKDVALEVQPLFRNPSGALQPLDDAQVSFAAPCAVLEPTSPTRALVGLQPGVNSCDLTITANPGGAQAHLALRRELELQILFEGQAADEVHLQESRDVDLTYSARALDKDVAIKPQWKGEHGAFQIFDGGRRVRFTLDRGAREGTVVLLDGDSGATDQLAVRMQDH